MKRNNQLPFPGVLFGESKVKAFLDYDDKLLGCFCMYLRVYETDALNKEKQYS